MNKFLALACGCLLIDGTNSVSASCMPRNIFEISIYGSAIWNNFKSATNKDKGSNDDTQKSITDITNKIYKIVNDFITNLNNTSSSNIQSPSLEDISKAINIDNYDGSKLNKNGFGFGGGLQYAYRCTPNVYCGLGAGVEKSFFYNKKSDEDNLKDYMKVSAACVLSLNLGFSDASGKFAFEIGPSFRICQYELNLKPYIQDQCNTLLNSFATKYGITIPDSTRSSIIESFACKPKKTCYQWGAFAKIKYMFNKNFGAFLGYEYSFKTKITNKESPIEINNSCGRLNLGVVFRM